MLPTDLKALNYHKWDKEEWEAYVNRIGVPEDKAKRQFFRQVVYDHFEHHNEHYPEFEIDNYEYNIVKLSVLEVRDKVGFFYGKSIAEMWGDQYDQFEEDNADYLIFKKMSQEKTPPFPPIVIDSCQLVDKSWRVYGRPLHLIEGTHRTSYLIRMAERGIIAWQSEHEFVLLTPKIA
ncbi:MAG: hypothetical protein AB2598_20080 [Candidatus Thiodiazotropha sp.]